MVENKTGLALALPEEWQPMPPQMGPPLPKSMEIYWPWYKVPAPPEVIYSCPYCEAEFATEAELQAHIATAHPAEPPQIIYMCPYCGAKFSTMSALQAHITAIHPPAPPPVVYACPYCPATFATEAELAYHIETVHPPAPPPVVYTCPHCGAQFATEAELASHIETIHPPAPPPGVADIKVENLTIDPSEVYIGETVEIGVVARNAGDASGTREVTCNVNGKVSKETVELGPGDSRPVTFEAIPQQAKTYQVSVNGLTGSFVASKAPPATGMITLYGTGFDVKGTDWNWLAQWNYADGTVGVNPDDYYGWRGYNDACTPAKPIPLDNLVISQITVGSYEYGYSGLGSFGPFKVEDGKTYVLDVKTRKLSER
ncbi:unnamed protein product [marine sediment metagenome]|uniref:C2H2-type domain-containing protein n=1 Tax=marine sediment metagenome TaxID=412755 RepID=X1RSR9_9ZZZZ